MTCDITSFKKCCFDQKLHALYKTRQALQHILASKQSTRNMIRSLARKLVSLSPPLSPGRFDWVEIRDKLDVRLKEYCDSQTQACLGEWKKDASTW